MSSGVRLAPATIAAPPARERALRARGRWLVQAPARAEQVLRDLLVPHGTAERVAVSVARGPLAAVLAPILFRPPADVHDAEVLAERIDAALAPDGVLLRHTDLRGQRCAWTALRDYEASQRGRVVALVTRPGDVRPAAVLKLRPRRGAGRSLAEEGRALDWTRVHVPAELAALVPHRIADAVQGGDEALLVSWRPGRTQDRDVLASWRAVAVAERHAVTALGWLASFQRATARGQVRAADVLEMIEKRLAACTLPMEDVCLLVARIHGWRRVLEDVALPVCVAHGDYWARNVLVERGAVSGVVDWEHFQPASDPLRDAFHYAVTAALRLGARAGLSADAAFRHGLLSDTPAARVARAGVHRWADGLGVPRAALRPLFETWIVLHSAAAGGKEADPFRWLTWTIRSSRCAFSG